MIRLTDEQQRIVLHDHGPALVFAVAGSGKTTAMVHRIERLVRERVFPVRSILATSFGRATVRDIRGALQRWPHCSGVPVATLHSVGYRVLRRAQERNLRPDVHLPEGEAVDLDRHVLFGALDSARREAAEYKDLLESLDHDDFLSYVGACKGNLRYADLDRADLPPDALAVARQAEPPEGMDWYLDLYRRFERVRLERNAVTFDDMLMTGWETLVRFPEIADELRGRTACVLVDEFQDVNRAQAEILDLLTAGPRNYMAIGDDDQTIYEWRGADPGFILGFSKRYDAARYLISDNFRSKASHLALANKVIERNQRREPKRLSLTQGFDGHTLLHYDESAEQMGRAIVEEIAAALEEGHSPEQIAVLVRLYAQTPYIEYFMIESRIPYRVVGSVPFYQRSEVLHLLDYVRLAAVERDLQSGARVADEDVAGFGRAWTRVYNRPTRYLSRALADQIGEAVVHRGASLARTLFLESSRAAGSLSERLEDLASLVKWLAATLDSGAASDVLVELERRLDYKAYLARTSGFVETGQSRAANVDAFIAYSREKGTLADLMRHLDFIAFHRLGENPDDPRGLITMMTIYRAKGLQWPIVFVPNCNQGTLPLVKAAPDGRPLAGGAATNLEEERRLFYVALTRAQQTLHLHILKGSPISQFLEEADAHRTLDAVGALGASLARDPAEWTTQDALAMARHTHAYGFDRYFTHWWAAPEERMRTIAGNVRRLFAVAVGRNLHRPLGLEPEHARIWDGLAAPDAPAPAAGDEIGAAFATGEYLDLEQFVPPPAETRAARPAGWLQRLTSRPGGRPDPFQAGDRVRHKAFGVGTVVSTTPAADRFHVLVRFDDARVGPKTVVAEYLAPEAP